MVTDYVISTIQYIKNNLQVEAIGAVVIIALILLMVISILFLAFRSVRLWYWRINDQMKALENIDKSLDEIKQILPANIGLETPMKIVEDKFLEQRTPLKEECVTETTQDEPQEATPKIVFDKMDKDERTIIKPGYNIGKTGKIYAEEMLREQIQF
ncbi:MAG: hypothetical protein AB9836_09940 [Aminipila sp.]